MEHREQILTSLRSALEPLEYVQAMYEGGAAAFGRLDEHSDIDLVLVADEEHIDDVFAALEMELSALGPLDQYWDVPQPAWHGMRQRLYHVAGTPPFLHIDVCVQATGQPHSLTAREQHGEPVVHFDKAGAVVVTALDRAAHTEAMQRRFESLRASLPLLHDLVRKEVARRLPADAADRYHNYALRPLVELLRMRHCPDRYSWGMRYLRLDLPADAVARLDRLAYPGSLEALAALLDEAAVWSNELIAELEPQLQRAI